jgi:hypothetical protein
MADIRAAIRLKAVPREPQDAVYAMFAAARAGDVKSFLGHFTGAMERSLRQSLAESGNAGFANYLIRSNADVKGIAVSEPQPATESQMKLRVEYVYQDRTEAQTMYLENVGGAWKVSHTDSDERVKTPVPYGTPIIQVR